LVLVSPLKKASRRVEFYYRSTEAYKAKCLLKIIDIFLGQCGQTHPVNSQFFAHSGSIQFIREEISWLKSLLVKTNGSNPYYVDLSERFLRQGFFQI
jgi:hypothetical protein